MPRYEPEGEALGRQLKARGRPYTIVGVVRTTPSNAFGEPKTPAIYFSYKDNSASPRSPAGFRRAGSPSSTPPSLFAASSPGRRR